MMTHAQIEERARERAATEHLHCWKLTHNRYAVKSRQVAPGSMHLVTVSPFSLSCDCEGYQYRASCTHIEAVRRRLVRETQSPKASKAAPTPMPTEDAAARKAKAKELVDEIWGK